MGPPGVPGSSPQTDDCAELVPVLERALGYLSPDDRPTLSPGLPLLMLSPGLLLKESLMARLPSLAWVFPGLRACLIWTMLVAILLVHLDQNYVWSCDSFLVIV